VAALQKKAQGFIYQSNESVAVIWVGSCWDVNCNGLLAEGALGGCHHQYSFTASIAHTP